MDDAVSHGALPPVHRPTAPLLSLWLLFLRVGLLSFGGGVPALTYRELVDRKGWINDGDFLTGLTLAQFLPGANPVNLALYFGYRLRGWIGALVSACGLIMPAFCVIMTLGFLYRHFGTFSGTHTILLGIASVGVGMTVAVGAQLAKHVARSVLPVLIAIAIFVVVGVLRWPTVPVVLAAAPLSVLLAYVMERRRLTNAGPADGA
ncbi:MAG TPA: chromate transporter [Xanthobacteraceae bacterium]|jgi:chromate transporter|nr:chromate transporter [Xanthobacteraceae bacterium]